MKQKNDKIEPHPITCNQINQAGIKDITFEIRAPDIVEQLRKDITRLRTQLNTLSDEYELNLCKKCQREMGMMCPGEWRCTGC